MNEWNIQSRAHACGLCARPFADQRPYHTVLVDVKNDFLRRDVCAECWAAKFSEVRSQPGFISCWQGVYEAPPPVSEPVNKETAETLLRKIIELNDPRYAHASYILAVMLERKRIFKVKEQVMREGRRTFIYEQPKSGDLFTITDPDLHLDQLEEVQRDVAALLEHGLNPPAHEPMTNSPTETPGLVEPVEARPAN